MKKELKIKVTKNGPYEVLGDTTLIEKQIVCNQESIPEKWKSTKKFPVKEKCHLCRCGNSNSKPFCDGSHSNGFEGKETSNFRTYDEEASVLEGPDLILKDNEKLCASAKFCHGLSGTWNLTKTSNNKENKQAAITQCSCCPSGRLTAFEKSGKECEQTSEQEIALTKHEDNTMGPLWIKGKIPIESVSGKQYEKRNRVTLCRCGKSSNKPFCDSSHLS